MSIVYEENVISVMFVLFMLGGLSKHEVELASHFITSIPDAIKIGQLVQRLLGCKGRWQKTCTQSFRLVNYFQHNYTDLYYKHYICVLYILFVNYLRATSVVNRLRAWRLGNWGSIASRFRVQSCPHCPDRLWCLYSLGHHAICLEG